jgi:hypothetical protein
LIIDRLLVEQYVIMLPESPNLALENGGKVLKVVLVMGIHGTGYDTLARTTDSAKLSHHSNAQSRFMPALTPTDWCELGKLTLDQSTVVRIHVPEPLPLVAA